MEAWGTLIDKVGFEFFRANFIWQFMFIAGQYWLALYITNNGFCIVFLYRWEAYMFGCLSITDSSLAFELCSKHLPIGLSERC